MCALQQVTAQSSKCDLASIHFHLRCNLSRRHIPQSESADMQGTARLNGEKRRAALGFAGVQNAVPRMPCRTRRKPLGKVPSRKLVAPEIELKRAVRHDRPNDGRNDARSKGCCRTWTR